MATKKDIIKNIAAEMNVSQTVAHKIVQRAFGEIIETLIREKRIELRNFGVFEVRLRAPRKARNPRTNERVDVPSRVGVSFKPGKEMTRRLAELLPEEFNKAKPGPVAMRMPRPIQPRQTVQPANPVSLPPPDQPRSTPKTT